MARQRQTLIGAAKDMATALIAIRDQRHPWSKAAYELADETKSLDPAIRRRVLSPSDRPMGDLWAELLEPWWNFLGPEVETLDELEDWLLLDCEKPPDPEGFPPPADPKAYTAAVARLMAALRSDDMAAARLAGAELRALPYVNWLTCAGCEVRHEHATVTSLTWPIRDVDAEMPPGWHLDEGEPFCPECWGGRAMRHGRQLSETLSRATGDK
jgi:hypothetical protein